MAYDEEVADRLRQATEGLVGISEVRMMGGLCFLVNGNMLGGVDRTKQGVDRLMFRVGKDNQAEALSRPGAEPMVMGGRTFGGLVFVPDEVCDAQQLRDWVALALSFAGALPPKKKK